MVTIARFSLPIDAQIARAKLESEGIPAFVADEHTVNMQWLYSDAMGGVRLQVPESCAEKAHKLLLENAPETEIDKADDSLTKCPACGSSRMRPFTKGKRMAFVAFLLFSFPLWPFKRQLKCTECGRSSD